MDLRQRKRGVTDAFMDRGLLDKKAPGILLILCKLGGSLDTHFQFEVMAE